MAWVAGLGRAVEEHGRARHRAVHAVKEDAVRVDADEVPLVCVVGVLIPRPATISIEGAAKFSMFKSVQISALAPNGVCHNDYAAESA